MKKTINVQVSSSSTSFGNKDIAMTMHKSMLTSRSLA